MQTRTAAALVLLVAALAVAPASGQWEKGGDRIRGLSLDSQPFLRVPAALCANPTVAAAGVSSGDSQRYRHVSYAIPFSVECDGKPVEVSLQSPSRLSQ